MTTTLSEPTFFNFNDCAAELLVPADRWLFQSGNRWVAVRPDEDSTSWFDDGLTGGLAAEVIALLLELPISDVPASGLLIWWDIRGNAHETKAETFHQNVTFADSDLTAAYRSGKTMYSMATDAGYNTADHEMAGLHAVAAFAAAAAC